MPIDPTRLRQLIAARRFEDVARRLPEASADDLAAIPTEELLTYLDSLTDSGRKTIPDRVPQTLRCRRPTGDTQARRLAGWLLLAGLKADAEQVIEAMLGAAGDKEKLVWQWILHLVGLGASVEARAQLAAPPARYLGALRRELAAAHIDLEEGKFAAAAARLEPIADRQPETAKVRATLERARTCLAIAACFAAARGAADGPPDYAVFAVNLDEEVERFARLQAQIATGSPTLVRIPGVRGRYLSDATAARLGDPQTRLKKGTLGCFLAHVAAWERFRASIFDHGLIVEDDANVAIDLPPSVAALDLPPGYDLCFATYGMEPPAWSATAGRLHVAPVAVTVTATPHGLEAPGGYGYFLSRPGVEKLLARVGRDGFGGDLDWRLLAYSLRAADYDGLPPDSIAAFSLRQHRAFIEPEASVAGYCLHPALVMPNRGRSIRMADNIEP